MKVFISVDMEGITGVTSFDDVDSTKPAYERFRKIMTTEVNAVIEGALMGEATSVVVNDSHGGMRNVLIESLNPRAELISGSTKPLGMMCGVDSGVDLAILLGCHAKAGTANAILDHTWSGARVYACYFNGMELGEIGLNAALAGIHGVPVVLVVGDQAAAEEARTLLGEQLQTFAVKKAYSRDTARNLPLEYVHGRLRLITKDLIKSSQRPAPFTLEPPVTVTIDFMTSLQAEHAMIMPGTKREGGRRVAWTGTDAGEAFRAMEAMISLA